MTDLGNQDLAQDWPLSRKLRGLAVVALLSVILAVASVLLARSVLGCECSPWWYKGPVLALAALMMVLPVCMVVLLLRRKLKTGRFLMTRSESMAKRAAYQSKMGAGKPFWPQAWMWSFTLGFALFFVILGALAVAGAVYFGRSSWGALTLFLLLAGVALLLPGWMLFRAIRSKFKTGSFLPSQEELAKAPAKCGRTQPSWQRIILAIAYILLAAGWTQSTFSRHPHDLTKWFLSALWWFTAAIWTWQAFRPRKRECALPDEADGAQTPREVTAG